jgi:hypothetical protein
VTEGSSASFSVSATSSGTPGYQWQRSNNNGSSWTDISGATNATYQISPTVYTDSGAQFRCVVTNAAGSVYSDPVTLTVHLAVPTINGQPSGPTVTEGSPASFSVSANGSGTISYQWQQFDGSTWNDISGATSDTYEINPTALSDNGSQFRCVVSNEAGSVTSSVALLTVNAI